MNAGVEARGFQPHAETLYNAIYSALLIMPSLLAVFLPFLRQEIFLRAFPNADDLYGTLCSFEDPMIIYAC